MHIVNYLLQPFLRFGPAPSVAYAAANTPELSVLSAAVRAAGLTVPLSDPQLAVTVFAPTNEVSWGWVVVVGAQDCCCCCCVGQCAET